MLNRVVLQGNIGRDPRVSLTQDGKEIVNFSLATTHNWKDKTGEWQSTTDWHNVTIFRESTVGWAKDVLKRGDSVYVEGKLSYHHWTDRDGKKRSTAHVCVATRDGQVRQLRRLNPISLNSNNSLSLPSNPNSDLAINIQDKTQLQLKSASSPLERRRISEPETESESRGKNQDIPLEISSAESLKAMPTLTPTPLVTTSSGQGEEMAFQQKNQPFLY